jgi:hypothetical protein
MGYTVALEVMAVPGAKYASIRRPKVYEALRKRRGMSKAMAAKIANSDPKAMARKRRKRR